MGGEANGARHDGARRRGGAADAHRRARAGAHGRRRRQAVTERDRRRQRRRCACSPRPCACIRSGGIAKGEVLAVARIAGIMAAKRTADLIPLCHPLPIEVAAIDFAPSRRRPPRASPPRSRSAARPASRWRRSTAVSVAALTVYDMCKAVDRGMVITDLGIDEKRGGRSGTWTRKETADRVSPSAIALPDRASARLTPRARERPSRARPMTDSGHALSAFGQGSPRPPRPSVDVLRRHPRSRSRPAAGDDRASLRRRRRARSASATSIRAAPSPCACSVAATSRSTRPSSPAASPRRSRCGGASCGDDSDAYRLINGEGDGLPGMLVDRYGGVARGADPHRRRRAAAAAAGRRRWSSSCAPRMIDRAQRGRRARRRGAGAGDRRCWPASTVAGRGRARERPALRRRPGRRPEDRPLLRPARQSRPRARARRRAPQCSTPSPTTAASPSTPAPAARRASSPSTAPARHRRRRAPLGAATACRRSAPRSSPPTSAASCARATRPSTCWSSTRRRWSSSARTSTAAPVPTRISTCGRCAARAPARCSARSPARSTSTPSCSARSSPAPPPTPGATCRCSPTSVPAPTIPVALGHPEGEYLHGLLLRVD